MGRERKRETHRVVLRDSNVEEENVRKRKSKKERERGRNRNTRVRESERGRERERDSVYGDGSSSVNPTDHVPKVYKSSLLDPIH